MTLNPGQLQHKVQQLNNDMMATYEILHSLDTKVDALDTKFTAKFDHLDNKIDAVDSKLSGKIDEVLELVRGRI